jgi:zinc transport system substrate-binding protein
MLKRIPASCLLAGALLMFSLHSFAQPSVVTSIKPLQMIAAAVMDGVAQPAVLIPSNQSPHHYVLRPSDVARASNADVLLWVGEPMETYLATLFSDLDGGATVLEAASLEGLRLQAPGGGLLQEDESRYDTHLWLNSANAVLIAERLAAELVRRDPANAAAYQANLTAFQALMVSTQTQIAAQFASRAQMKFAVFHDGIRYFEQQFGLEHQFVVAPDHENQPGIRHLMEIQALIAQNPPDCLLEDVNTSVATVNTVLRDLPVKRVPIDPLGDAIVADKQGYAQLLTSLAAAFDTCLQAP